MKTQVLIFFYLLLRSSSNAGWILGGCTVPMNSLPNAERVPQPLFLKSKSKSTGNDAFLEPVMIDRKGTLRFQPKEEITISCPGGYIKIKDIPTRNSILTASCNNADLFTVDGKKATLKEIKCTKQPKQILRYNGKTCGNSKTLQEIEIGFQLDENRFFTQIFACFGKELQNTAFSVFNMTRTIAGYQVLPNLGPQFKEAGFYKLGKVKLDKLYERDVQRTSINKQLDLPSISYKYIHATGDYYLARGHLAAKVDFLYGTQQRLTYHFVNVAPQWQTLNAGNWLRLEDSVRNVSSQNALNLTVFTGTHGILSLANEETGELTPIYLYTERFKAIPVPEIFWKVVYHPESKSGVAFVAINNPYIKNYNEICPNICKNVTWIKWKPTEQKAGFAYCCEVDAFRKLVHTLPPFEVHNTLTLEHVPEKRWASDVRHHHHRRNHDL